MTPIMGDKSAETSAPSCARWTVSALDRRRDRHRWLVGDLVHRSDAVSLQRLAGDARFQDADFLQPAGEEARGEEKERLPPRLVGRLLVGFARLRRQRRRGRSNPRLLAAAS